MEDLIDVNKVITAAKSGEGAASTVEKVGYGDGDGDIIMADASRSRGLRGSSWRNGGKRRWSRCREAGSAGFNNNEGKNGR